MSLRARETAAVLIEVLGEFDFGITRIEPRGVHAESLGDGTPLEGHPEQVLPCRRGRANIIGTNGDVMEADVP